MKRKSKHEKYEKGEKREDDRRRRDKRRPEKGKKRRRWDNGLGTGPVPPSA